jgi:hypothetical protein
LFLDVIIKPLNDTISFAKPIRSATFVFLKTIMIEEKYSNPVIKISNKSEPVIASLRRTKGKHAKLYSIIRDSSFSGTKAEIGVFKI